MKTQQIVRLGVVGASLFLGACGSEEEIDSYLNSNSLRVRPKVFSNLEFQPSGIRVKANDKFTISGTGQVTVGILSATNPNTANQVISKYYVGIKGGLAGYFDGSTWKTVRDPMAGLFKDGCGVKEGETVINLLSNGTSGSVTVPAAPSSLNTFGPCCGSVARGMKSPYVHFPYDLVNGRYHYYMAKNSCSTTLPLGALIMKIIPLGMAIEDAPVISVGENFVSTPYIANVEGELYFAVNDFFREDNEGSFELTITQVP